MWATRAPDIGVPGCLRSSRLPGLSQTARVSPADQLETNIELLARLADCRDRRLSKRAEKSECFLYSHRARSPTCSLRPITCELIKQAARENIAINLAEYAPFLLADILCELHQFKKQFLADAVIEKIEFASRRHMANEHRICDIRRVLDPLSVAVIPIRLLGARCAISPHRAERTCTPPVAVSSPCTMDRLRGLGQRQHPFRCVVEKPWVRCASQTHIARSLAAKIRITN